MTSSFKQNHQNQRIERIKDGWTGIIWFGSGLAGCLLLACVASVCCWRLLDEGLFSLILWASGFWITGSIKYKWKELDDKSSCNSSCALNCNYLSQLLKVYGSIRFLLRCQNISFWIFGNRWKSNCRSNWQSLWRARSHGRGGKCFFCWQTLRRVFHVRVTCHTSYIDSTLPLVGKTTGRGFRIFCLHMSCQQLQHRPAYLFNQAGIEKQKGKKKSKAAQPWRSCERGGSTSASTQE